MVWYPHVTVAAVVERDGKFLLVRERAESGELVYNQPAGHLEENESLLQAVERETLEETGWHITPRAILGLRLYTAPGNGVSYLRCCFIADPLSHDPERTLDEGIEEAVWLSEEEILARREQLRSPLVWEAIADYRRGLRFPLDLLG